MFVKVYLEIFSRRNFKFTQKKNEEEDMLLVQKKIVYTLRSKISEGIFGEFD